MAEPVEPQRNPGLIRIGLAFVVGVIVIAVVLAIVIDEPAARAIFVGIAIVGGLQTWRLSRSIRNSSG